MLPLDVLIKLLFSFQEGRALLTAGQYEYKFTTKSAPTQVFLAETNAVNLPVCQGNVNTFGTQLLPDGFVLYANVQSETTEVIWQALLS